MSKKRKLEEEFTELAEVLEVPLPSPLVVTVDLCALLERYDGDIAAVYAIVGAVKDLLR